MVESKLRSGVQQTLRKAKLATSDKIDAGNSAGEASLLNQVRASVDVLIDVYRLYGFDDTGFRRAGAYEWYLRLATDYYSGDWLKLFKDKLASFFAYHIAAFDGSVPELPVVKAPAEVFCPSILLGSRAYRYQVVLMRGDSSTWRGFITSLLYSKKGFPRPGKAYLAAGEKSTFVTLTTQTPENATETVVEPFSDEQVLPPGRPVPLIAWGDDARVKNPYLPMTLSQKEFGTYVNRVVEEVFANQTYTDADRVRPFFPSTSANYNNSRTALGTVGTILDHPSLLLGLTSGTPLVTAKVSQHGSFTDVIVDDLELRARFAELYARTVEAALTEPAIAVPLALPEALKVRTITKGPPLLGFALKPLQKFLWSKLAKHKTFRFTGEPVSADALQAVVGPLKEGEKYLSADYSDATNSLYSWASDLVGHSLADKLQLSADERTLLIRGLTGHVMEIGKGKDKRSAPQVRGQLMGSVVSFPVLCIVNAAICLLAYELERGQKCRLKDLPLAVNGDDALLRGSPFLKEAWERMANYVGMKPSVGKVYYSAKYLNINSTSYEFHSEGYEWYQAKRLTDGSTIWRARIFELIPYVNMGLLYGLTRSGGEAGLDTVGDVYGSIGVRAHALLSSCPASMRLTVYKSYLSRNKERLSDARVPWFTPSHLGGLGLPILEKFAPNNLDLRVARKIYENPDKFQVPSPILESTWLTYKIAQKRLKDFPLGAMAVRSSAGVGGGSLQSLTATLCIEALFMVSASQLNPQLALSDKSGKQEDQLEVVYKSVRGLKDAVKSVGLSEGRDILAAANEQLRLDHLNALRKLNSAAIRDQSIPLPEPFRMDSFPKRPLNINTLAGTHSLLLDTQFGAEDAFPQRR